MVCGGQLGRRRATCRSKNVFMSFVSMPLCALSIRHDPHISLRSVFSLPQMASGNIYLRDKISSRVRVQFAGVAYLSQ